MEWFDRCRRRVSWNALVWLLLLGFIGYRIWPQAAAALAVGARSDVAPEFTLPTLDGGEAVSLAALRGQVVLVNFWATWCPPCRLEMPGFERVYRDKQDRGFAVVALSTDRGSQAKVRDFAEDRGVTFPVAMATPELTRAYGGIRALPTSFLIDRSGRIRHEVTGFFAEPALRLAVDRLLAEAPGESVGGEGDAVGGAR
jgi:peroxiredoxin